MTLPKIPESLAVYVHWPWCLAKCPYCDFNAHVWDDIPRKAYISALVSDLTTMRELSGPRRIESVFFGGGTPSLMRAGEVAAVLETVADLWDFSGAEVTLECNPTSSSAALFGELKAAGVNRVSVGVQSTKAEWLEFLGRKHDVRQALETLKAAQKVFARVNADVIFGLPNQNLDIWKQQLKQLSCLDIGHVSAYQLTIEPQTRFFGQVRRGEWAPLEDDTQADFMAATEEVLAAQGYAQYEVSNHARDGQVCRHNLHVWRYGDYAGVGAGAHGRLTLTDGRKAALKVTKHPRNYLARAARREPTFAQELLTPQETATERLLSGLRLNEGVSFMDASSGDDEKPAQIVSGKVVDLMVKSGFLQLADGMLRLTGAGRRVMDGVLAELVRA
ncbi:MAG: radical SAM family heme chaperone HemW [Pseudomonadaceae bacterium]|nr:radical SAM family heme chaperone HemW [Pseudomonadaceae bacterium]